MPSPVVPLKLSDTLAMLGLLVALSGCTRYSGPMTEEAVVESTHFWPTRSSTSYGVVFRCDGHQLRFAVQGEAELHRGLWARFIVGERVRVTYREKRDSDGRMTGHDFLDAQPVY